MMGRAQLTTTSLLAAISFICMVTEAAEDGRGGGGGLRIMTHKCLWSHMFMDDGCGAESMSKVEIS